jgi:hypothetical protein
LAQQQQAAVTAQIPTTEIGFNDSPSKAPKIDPILRTLWHWQSPVVIDVEHQ